MPILEAPIVPGDLVVLAVGIVVPQLGPPQLIPAEQHRSAEGEKQSGEKIFHLTVADLDDLGIIGLPLDTVVGAVVLVVPVLVVLAVGLVVLLAVGHQIVEGESVVGGDKVDAVKGFAPVSEVEVGAAGQTGGQMGT